MIRLLLILLALAATPAFSATVTDMRLIGDAARTRLVVDLDEEPQYGLMRLADPDRLVIDMADTVFADSVTPGDGRGLVSDYRYGLIVVGKARIVLDLGKPVEVDKTFVQPATADQPARLVVDLTPTSQDAFMVSVAADRSRRGTPIPEPVAFSAVEPAGAVPEKPVVVIDPGHGGIDPGKIGRRGVQEKDLTLAFAKTLAEVLERNGRVTPVLTREGDVFLSLSERIAFAQARHAALLISVHTDSVRQRYVRGATVYTLSETASDALAATLAEEENRSDLLAGLELDHQPDEVANILFDLARRETRNLSVRFARTLVEDLGPVLRFHKTPWRRASLKVLKAPDVPSVLLEIGFLSNAEDAKLLQSEAWREKSSAGLARAVEQFVAETHLARR
jgi:N-acetylmuramoyl-L-alanine amidase